MKATRPTPFAFRRILTLFLVGMARCAVRRRRAQRQATATNGRDVRLGLRSALRFALGGDSAARCPYQRQAQSQDAPQAIQALKRSRWFGQSWLAKSGIGHRPSAIAFTLLELLVVISILGILAALSVPALKSIGKSNIQVSASRQLLDDIGRARQLAISQHTTVYMMFVPANFWLFQNNWWNNLAPEQKAAGTNLLDNQLSGYAFVSMRSVGDQPGQGLARYIGRWRSLPDGAFIAASKFDVNYLYPKPYFRITDHSLEPVAPNPIPIYSFNYTNNLPFPTETNFNNNAWLPFIAFNYRGQLTVDGVEMSDRDEYIPLAQGNIGYAVDAKKALTLNPADFSEIPPGNSTNSMFNVIRIDRLTGRATLLKQKVQ